jgi:1-acyl-sn-glycerol-3-phosphate acyltransferase
MQKMIEFLLFHLTTVNYENTEQIPAEGPVIIVTNHLSRLDIPVILGNPIRPEISALVAKKYQSRPFFKWILDTCGIIYIDRTRADFSAFREARKVILSGTAMGIAPEGTRSDDKKLAEGKDGAAMLAMQLQVPVVPVGIQGTEDALHKIFRFQRPTITARFGERFMLPKLTGEHRAEQLQAATEEIMCRIAVLLPEKYRGFYRDNPRLKEFEATASPTSVPVF